MSSIFSRKKKRGDITGSELEHLTTELIEQTKAELREQFQREMSRLKPGEPIEKDVADRTIRLLLDMAAADRQNLIGRIENDVTSGNLFEHYYGKMETINRLTNSAYAKMQKLDYCKEKYDTNKALYEKLTGKMYVEGTVPSDTKKRKNNKPKKDIWESMAEHEKVFEEGDDGDVQGQT